MSQKKSIFFDFSRLFSSNIISIILRFVSGFVSARVLGPVNLGYWKGVELVLMYFQHSQLGTYNAMTREIPIYKGRGDLSKADYIRDIAFGFTLTVPFFIAGVIFISSFFFHENRLFSFSLRMAVLIVSIRMIQGYFNRLNSANKQFGIISTIILVSSFITPIITIALVIKYNIYGKFWAEVTIAAIMLSIFVFHNKEKIRIKFDWGVTVSLIKVGFPLLLAGLMFGLLTTVDRILILKFLSVKELGYYALGLMLVGILQKLPESIGEVMYPRVNEKWGQTGSVASLENYACVPAKLLSMIMPLGIGVLIIILPIVTDLLLPKYKDGVLAAQILVVGVGIRGINILITINKQNLYLAMQTIGLIINVGLGFTFLNLGFGINGVAAATVISYVIYYFLLTALSLKAMGKEFKELLWFYIKLLTPILYTCGVIYVVQTIFLNNVMESNRIYSGCITIGAFTMCYLPVLFFLYINLKKYGLSPLPQTRRILFNGQ